MLTVRVTNNISTDIDKAQIIYSNSPGRTSTSRISSSLKNVYPEASVIIEQQAIFPKSSVLSQPVKSSHVKVKGTRFIALVRHANARGEPALQPSTAQCARLAYSCRFMCPALRFAPWPQSESRPHTLFHCHVQKHRVIRGFMSARCSSALPTRASRVLKSPVHLSDSAQDHCCLIKQALLPPKTLPRSLFFQLSHSLTSGWIAWGIPLVKDFIFVFKSNTF